MVKRHRAKVDPQVETTNWAEMLVMVYDRLVLDVQRGLDAQRRGDHEETMRQLTHALEVVSELQRSVRVDAFRGGYDLASLYEFLNRRLVMASIGNDEAITDECLTLVTDLCHTWRQVALASAAESTADHLTA